MVGRIALLAAAVLAFPAGAAAAVTASENASVITISGTAGGDGTTITDSGANAVISNATAGAGCTQVGLDARCPRGSRTIAADLGAGPDSLNNASAAEADVSGGDGADLLIGRLRSAQGGAAQDVMRPSGMTGTVSLAGGEGFDVYDIGADTGAADVVTDTGANMVDYVSRTGGTGVTVTANDNTANDGAAGEHDNVGTAATVIRGTVADDAITGSATNADLLDGDLGADAIDGGDNDPTGELGGITARGDAVVFALDAAMPYPRPAATSRTAGLAIDLAAGTTSEGDTLTRIDDASGTPFADVITGSSDRDAIEAFSGFDVIRSGGGEDLVACLIGVDGFLRPVVLVNTAQNPGAQPLGVFNDCKLDVSTGEGDDIVAGGPFGDTMRGGAGSDTLGGADGDDLVVGGPGTDAVEGAAGSDTVSFAEDTAGVDVDLTASAGEDGSGGFENVIGSPFDDVITGDAGPNTLDGGAGTDTVSYAGRTAAVNLNLSGGRAAEDTIAGFENATTGSGDDTLRGTTGANILRGGAGVDTVSFDYLPAPSRKGEAGITHTLGGPAAGNSENDTTLDIENAIGSKRDDVLIGTAGANRLAGGEGDDRLVPGAGNDRLVGNAGVDTLDYSASGVAIHANLSPSGGLRVHEFDSDPTDDRLADPVENVLGTAFADVLRGADQSANLLRGNGGDDVIDGGRGDDTLEGGAGADRFGAIADGVQELAPATNVVAGNAAAPDGRDLVLGGPGNDDVNVRDGFRDDRVACGAGRDVGRQDLADDGGDLRLASCETLETTAEDQQMTRIVRVRRSGGRLVLRLACPKDSKVACRGRAGRARSAGARRVRRATRYRIRQGRRARVRVRGGGRFLLLVEKDQAKRLRRTARRL